MHFEIQFSTQAPQPVHFSGSMCAQKSFTVIAPASHTFTHFIQPIQALLHAFFATAPLSWLEQRTTACSFTFSIVMSFRGQADAQSPQPPHFFGSTTATPLQIVIASLIQTLAQSPIERQPNGQEVIPEP